MPFKNRKEAGQALARSLAQLQLDDPLIMALPRGGIPVGYEVALALHAPLEVLVVRKIGAPNNPEYGIGAITEDGFYWINTETAASIGVTQADIDLILKIEQGELHRRIQLYRGKHPRAPIEGRTIVLVDDGLATGITAKVASIYLKNMGAKQVILAIPVGSFETIQKLEEEGKAVVCIEKSDYFFSVSQFYEDFTQVSDEEVIFLLNDALTKYLPLSTEYSKQKTKFSEEVSISDGSVRLMGQLQVPEHPEGLVIFAHGSGSSRLSPRNKWVAQFLNEAGFGTLLFDLLMPKEAEDPHFIFNIPLLANRLKLATDFARSHEEVNFLPFGYFGASTGAAAALWAAADLQNEVVTIVARGGRPDLARSRLTDVIVPTLLLVGGADEPVLELNQAALLYLQYSNLMVIPNATHLFEEPGALEEVARHSVSWFKAYLSHKRTYEELIPSKAA